MKIGFIGPTCNNMYIMARICRACGYEAHYYHMWSKWVMAQPYWEDMAFSISYEVAHDDRVLTQLWEEWHAPEWAHLKREARSSWLRYANRLRLAVKDLGVRYLMNPSMMYEYISYVYPHYHDELSGCDLVVACGTAAMFISHKSGARYVYTPHGADLETGMSSTGFLRSRFERGLRDASLCWNGRPGFCDQMAKYGVARSAHIHLMYEDVTKLPQRDCSSILPVAARNAIQDDSTLVYFISSRIDDRVKGTAKFMRALKNVVRRSGRKPFVIIMGWGADRNKYEQELENDKDLAECVCRYSGILSKPFLRWLLLHVDVVVDQFNIGYYGSLFVEGALSGKPVLANISSILSDSGDYEAPPINNCVTEAQIENYIQRLMGGEVDHKAIGADMRAWALRNHCNVRHFYEFLAKAMQ